MERQLAKVENQHLRRGWGSVLHRKEFMKGEGAAFTVIGGVDGKAAGGGVDSGTGLSSDREAASKAVRDRGAGSGGVQGGTR